MSTAVYVENLHQNTCDQDLIGLFAEAGSDISAQVIASNETDQSFRSGIITMASEEGAKQGIVSLNGRMVDGRIFSVTEVRAREGDGGGSYSHVHTGVYAISERSNKN